MVEVPKSKVANKRKYSSGSKETIARVRVVVVIVAAVDRLILRQSVSDLDLFFYELMAE